MLQHRHFPCAKVLRLVPKKGTTRNAGEIAQKFVLRFYKIQHVSVTIYYLISCIFLKQTYIFNATLIDNEVVTTLIGLYFSASWLFISLDTFSA